MHINYFIQDFVHTMYAQLPNAALHPISYQRVSWRVHYRVVFTEQIDLGRRPMFVKIAYHYVCLGQRGGNWEIRGIYLNEVTFIYVLADPDAASPA